MSILGANIDEIDVPVCKIFSPKIVLDQLCYTFNPNQYLGFMNENVLGFTFYLDHNEEREFISGKFQAMVSKNASVLIGSISKKKYLKN